MPDVPAEAVEAARDVARFARLSEGSMSGVSDRTLVDLLAAALPHLRERWLAEVEGALRNDVRFDDWFQADWQRRGWFGAHARGMVADYLRAALGAGAGGED
jgi:hypothetical protein